jgi:hypothetical protein
MNQTCAFVGRILNAYLLFGSFLGASATRQNRLLASLYLSNGMSACYQLSPQYTDFREILYGTLLLKIF